MNEQRIIIQKYCSRYGKDVLVLSPSNAHEVLSKLEEGKIYTVTHRYGRRSKETILEFFGVTEFNKSCLFKDKSRSNGYGQFVEMAVPTQNILNISSIWN
jgi:hypothetical protein